jgi:DNA-directed RNA polymerase subunit RPC12/RpoP
MPTHPTERPDLDDVAEPEYMRHYRCSRCGDTSLAELTDKDVHGGFVCLRCVERPADADADADADENDDDDY